jgi:hypothetical protein
MRITAWGTPNRLVLRSHDTVNRARHMNVTTFMT